MGICLLSYINDQVEIFCRFLSYSLDGRIIPRHKILVENRINMKLRYMLASTDEEFEKRIEAIKERRKIFESGIRNDDPLTTEKIDGNDATVSRTIVDFHESDVES